MSKQRARELREQGDRLFSKRSALLTRWQDIAEQFYVERSDFTTTRSMSDDYAGHLMTGLPAMARRDLANSLSAMLRPRGQQWFNARTGDERINKDANARKWLDHASDIMRRIMYDNRAKFVRATKEGDNDFVTFGQCVIQVTLNANADGLLYRSWHLRDVVWSENAEQDIDTVHRNWKIEARNLARLFPKTVDAKVRECAEKEPFREIKCRHIVVPADDYDEKKKARFPFVSLYIDCEHETILEEVPQRRLSYIIPRWVTLSGTQYAHSPATVIATPDARLLQQITLTLLEAGQKSVDPPMVAVGEMISGGVNTYAGGVTWVDAEYDERLGEVLRPMSIDSGGLNWGVDREERIASLINKAFYLDQIRVPETGDVKSATEIRIRHEEWMRSALPLFEPMEAEYNGALCDETFEIAMEQGAFGNPDDIPQVLRGQELRFQFESPIQSAAKRANAQAFQESAALLSIAAQLDPNAVHVLNVQAATRDALDGAGAPAEWINSDEDIAEANAAADQQAAMAQAMQAVGGGAQVAEQVGKAGQEMAAAGIM
jgi:hypothetical protein